MNGCPGSPSYRKSQKVISISSSSSRSSTEQQQQQYVVVVVVAVVVVVVVVVVVMIIIVIIESGNIKLINIVYSTLLQWTELTSGYN